MNREQVLNKKTLKELMEESAGMPLDDMFFKFNDINPDAVMEEGKTVDE